MTPTAAGTQRDSSTRPLRLAAVAVAIAVTLAIGGYVLVGQRAPAPAGDQAATLTPTPASQEALQALAKLNGRPCAAVASVTRINADDFNLECTLGADGAKRAMYLVNLKAGTVR